jgi:hypothetical protein
MHPTDRAARVAGALYLALAVTGPVRLVYIPHALLGGSATATADAIVGHELLFRVGIVSDLLSGTLSIFLMLALYRLLAQVDRSLALLMAILGGPMPAGIYFVNVLNDVAALLLARGADFLSAFEKPQRDALTMLFLSLHEHGVLANEIFWGLWLFPFGALVFRSGFLPRVLGVWLFVNGLAYLTFALTGFLTPHYAERLSKIGFPALLGELAIMLWLLIRGAGAQPARPAVS